MVNGCLEANRHEIRHQLYIGISVGQRKPIFLIDIAISRVFMKWRKWLQIQHKIHIMLIACWTLSSVSERTGYQTYPWTSAQDTKRIRERSHRIPNVSVSEHIRYLTYPWASAQDTWRIRERAHKIPDVSVSEYTRYQTYPWESAQDNRHIREEEHKVIDASVNERTRYQT